MEKEQNHSRVVVDTPNSRREYVRTETEHVPERSGMSGGTVAAIIVAVGAVVVIFFLLMYNRQLSDQANTNAQIASQTAATQPQQPQQPIIVQQPAQAPQQPVIVEQPAAAPPQTIVVPGPSSPSTTTPSGTDDSSVQEALNRKFEQDEVLSTEPVTAVVLNGQAVISGTVKSDNEKSRAERLARGVKGVRRVDNQITVTNS